MDYLYDREPGVLRPLYPVTDALGLVAPVRNDRVDPFSASGRLCRGNERGGHEACLPGGLMKAITLPASVDGCDTVAVSDALGAFEWVCRDTTPVEVVSVGLTGSFADLIDVSVPGAPAFRPNQVTVTDDGLQVAQSPLTTWWTTPVMTLPEDGQMRDRDTVYVVDSPAVGVPLVMNRAQRSLLLVSPQVMTPVTGSGIAGGAVVTVLRSPFAVVSGARCGDRLRPGPASCEGAGAGGGRDPGCAHRDDRRTGALTAPHGPLTGTSRALPGRVAALRPRPWR